MGEQDMCIEDRAGELGEKAGKLAGAWIIDGNTPDERCRELLEGIEDCDPLIMDSLPLAPLSGEWADGPSQRSIALELGIDPDGDDALAAADAYADAFGSGVCDQVCADARARLGLK